jgi:hypothetical protein
VCSTWWWSERDETCNGRGIKYNKHLEQLLRRTVFMITLINLLGTRGVSECELWTDSCSLSTDQDDAPACSSFRVSQFLARKGTSALRHEPYSSCLAPVDFWLFAELKSVLKRKCFSDVKNIKSSVKKILTLFFRIYKLLWTMAVGLGTL